MKKRPPPAGHSLALNRHIWSSYRWPADGDEWTDQSAFCGRSYAEWKESLFSSFIDPLLPMRGTAVDIGSGHGRWTAELLRKAGWVFAIDATPACVDFCAILFATQNATAILASGCDLPGICDDSIDLVWSYDTFVHLAKQDIGGYLHEIRRVLSPRGSAVLHHAVFPPLRLFFKRHILERLIDVPLPLQRLLFGRRVDGWRVELTLNELDAMARSADLWLAHRTSCWGESGGFSCQLFGDVVSVFSRSFEDAQRVGSILNGGQRS